MPALLVMGVSWSLSGRGRAWIGGHDCFHRAPDTPLVLSCLRNNVKRVESHDLLLIHEGRVSTSGPYVSVVKGKVMIGCFPRVLEVLRDRGWHQSFPDLVGKVRNLCRVSNYSNRRVHGDGKLGGGT